MDSAVRGAAEPALAGTRHTVPRPERRRLALDHRCRDHRRRDHRCREHRYLTHRYREHVKDYWLRIAQSARNQNRPGGSEQHSDSDGEAPRRRTDVRLALPAAAVWGASLLGLWLQPWALAVLCTVLVGLAGLLFARFRAGLRTGPRSGRWRVRKSVRQSVRQSARQSVQRSFLATTAVSLLLAATAAAHSAVASSQRFDGPLAAAIADGRSVVALVEVAGTPRVLRAPGQAGTPERWSIPVWTQEVSTGGVLVRTRARLLVTGGGAWGAVVPGQSVRTTGKLRPADPGREEAGVLAASSGPGGAHGFTGLQEPARDLRERFLAAAGFLPPDARGLLPGMVTGDTSALDEGLESAMQSVGLTHLTAVSGANCSLVLGALLLAGRRFRLARVPAAAAAVGGLALFVLLVGPDASVLRAAVMGGVGVIALAGGRSGRGLSFLCLAVIGLLLADPGLGGSYGFLLSVLATLGIIVLGRRIVGWTPVAVPRWLAAAAAVPLSAQLLCGPVVVLLQPQFSTYSLLANIIAAPLVAPVTLLGTAGVPLVVLVPWAAAALIAVAGTFSACIAAVARFTAAMPGASLPWPEGAPGLLSMALLSVLTVTLVWAAARPRRMVLLALASHRQTVGLLERMEGGMAAMPSARGLVRRPGHGRLELSTNLSGRKPRWPLRKSVQPVRRRRTPLHGATSAPRR